MQNKSEILISPEKSERFPGLSPRNFSEIPEGKLKTNPKLEFTKFKTVLVLGFWLLDIVSYFGFRASNFKKKYNV